jgi:hypothetical protein
VTHDARAYLEAERSGSCAPAVNVAAALHARAG